MLPSSRVRPPAVAGRFYPARPAELRGLVDRLLDAAAAGPCPAPRGAAPPALIAPHAGFVYSGPIAASAFTGWSGGGRAVRRVVLLGPNHYLPLRGLALPGAAAMATPLGVVPVAGEVERALRDLPQVAVDPEVHAPEHSLEVELPFLQVVLGDFEVVPLLVGEATAEEVATALEIAWTGPETAVVVSSDLSHYLPYEEARRVDGETARQVGAGRASLSPWQACGARAINGLLLAAARRGLKAELLDLRNSGDTAGGRDQVVGYGAFALA